MKIIFLKKIINYLNANYKSTLFGKDAIWFNKKGDIVAIKDGDTFEVIVDILKEVFLKP